MRREDRADALGVLYAYDSTGAEELDLSEVSARAARFAVGVVEHLEQIDDLIGSVSTSWRVARMPVVDRNILRLATFELLFTDLSKAVVINEAVELAKTYSTAKSGAFINGVLDTIALQPRDSTTPAP